MKTIIFTIAMVGLMFGSSGVLLADENMEHHHKQTKAKIKMQTTCPVMGGKVKKKFYADVKGKRIYVCCPMCIKKVKKDPEKYIKILKDKGQPILELKKQTTCPMMKGRKINKKLYVDAEGKRIYVCCKGCIGAVKKDPKKYIEELEAKGITLEDAPK